MYIYIYIYIYVDLEEIGVLLAEAGEAAREAGADGAPGVDVDFLPEDAHQSPATSEPPTPTTRAPDNQFRKWPDYLSCVRNTSLLNYGVDVDLLPED